MAPSTTFAERLAYARFVRHFRTGKCPDNAEIGRAVRRTGQWVTKISGRAEAPTDFRVQEPLAEFLGADVRWLFRGEGAPPEPWLWERWAAERRTYGKQLPRFPLKRVEGPTPAKKNPKRA